MSYKITKYIYYIVHKCTLELNILFDLGCIGCLLPPIGNYFVAEKIGAGDLEKFIGCLDFLGGVVIFSVVGQLLLRGRIREEDGISGTMLEDLLSAGCCLECSVCQTIHHVGAD